MKKNPLQSGYYLRINIELLRPKKAVFGQTQANDINPSHYDFWVVDLQGAEELFLAGANFAIKFCNALLVEVSTVEIYQGGAKWEHILHKLTNKGFDPVWKPSRPHDDVLFLRKKNVNLGNSNTGNHLSLIQADYNNYSESVTKLKNGNLNVPRVVSIETVVQCNARCVFCAYPSSSRQGQKMPEKMFLKIVDELTVIPESHHFAITLHRLCEPLLDNRLQYFHEIIADKLPSARHQFWSNRTMIAKGNFEWMTEHDGALTISLNSVNNEEHKSLMGFGVEKVFENLDYLHRLVDSGKFTLPVTLISGTVHQ